MLKFGTDGWRAEMDKEFTFENVELVAQAFSDFLWEDRRKKSAEGPPKVVVGYDWRKNSENYAKAFTEVLVGNGVQTLLSDAACTTPAVSLAVVNEKCSAGIAVTASHNPPRYNGIKIKTDFGGSAGKDITDAVERWLGKKAVTKKPFGPANPRIADLNEEYRDFVKKYVRLELIKDSPYKVLVDSMHGVGARHIETMLAGGEVHVATMRGARDVNFGGVNPEPIPQNLGPTMEHMKRGNFDLAIVTDGDADRVGVVAPGGEFVTPGVVLSLILLHFVEDLGRKGSVVTTISNTALVYKIARKLGLAVHETPVGFKYICQIMRRENVLVGGEESGGIGFQNYLYERDGILSGLLLMEMMAMRKQSFRQILEGVEREFGKFYYVRRDVHYPQERKAGLFQRLDSDPPEKLGGQVIQEMKKIDGIKFILKDGSWLLFRLSGTEPILRIYSEATSAALAETLVKEGEDFAFRQPE